MCLANAVACIGPATSPSTVASSPAADPNIGFSSLGTNGAPVTTYTESGFSVTTVSGDWVAVTTYGKPAPFIEFFAAGGSTVGGEVRVSASGSPFYFKSIDLYASTTPVPFTIKGLKGGTVVFTLSDTLPNTFGDFRTVTSPNSGDAIDALSIMLMNSAAACCRNPMGLDNIVLTTTPTAPSAPTAFSLSGQVTDGSGGGIAGSILSIADGPNARLAATTDATGNYRFTQLQRSGFTVNASATNYISQSKPVTLTSDQTLSFQLSRQPVVVPPAGTTILGFESLKVDAAPFNNYVDGTFTVRSIAGEWMAATMYGNPAPFIQFLTAGGTTAVGEVQVGAASGSPFFFKSVDVYSSTTAIPYVITGRKNSSTVFVLAGTVSNTFGAFRTVTNSDATVAVDTLSIALTNAAAPCCRNPMGLDTIVLSR